MGMDPGASARRQLRHGFIRTIACAIIDSEAYCAVWAFRLQQLRAGRVLRRGRWPCGGFARRGDSEGGSGHRAAGSEHWAAGPVTSVSLNRNAPAHVGPGLQGRRCSARDSDSRRAGGGPGPSWDSGRPGRSVLTPGRPHSQPGPVTVAE